MVYFCGQHNTLLRICTFFMKKLKTDHQIQFYYKQWQQHSCDGTDDKLNAAGTREIDDVGNTERLSGNA